MTFLNMHISKMKATGGTGKPAAAAPLSPRQHNDGLAGRSCGTLHTSTAVTSETRNRCPLETVSAVEAASWDPSNTYRVN